MSLGRLIELLFSNWYVLVIAYILFSGLIGRMKGSKRSPAETSGNPAPSAMPPFGGGGMGWPQRKGGAPAEGRKAEETGLRQPPAEADRKTAQQERKQKGPKVQPASTDFTGASPAAVNRTEAGRKPSGSLKAQQELARGVIWAEILGPPRAKRPYRR